MAQTIIQHPETIRFGSARLEIGPSVDQLTDVGACTGVKFTHEFERGSIKSDNAGVILERINNASASVEANLMEINLDVLAQYLSGISEVENVPATATLVEDEEHTLPSSAFIRLNQRNGDGTIATGVSVVTKNGGVSTEVDVDYYLSTDNDGYTVIARNPNSTKLSEGTGVVVEYTVTPAQAKRLHVGGKQKLLASVARLTNYNAAGEPLSLTVYKAAADTGIAIEFQADDAEETNVVPIKLVGTNDTTRALHDQLFVIEDQQFTV